MKSTDLDFLASALSEGDWAGSPEKFFKWWESRKAFHRSKVQRIPLKSLKNWHFDPATGNLGQETGRFFRVEGLWVETNFGSRRQWTQPIINQPEVGMLGFLTRKINGVLHFLVQAKTEPGNLGYLQLAPTLQATRSNFTCAHKGKPPGYLEYFIDSHKHKTLVDSLQSEQGARFFRKRNRNVILEVTEDIPLLDDYCWLTLGQIQRLLRIDNLVNMCTRSVLACIAFTNGYESRSAADALERLLAHAPETRMEKPASGSFQSRILDSESRPAGLANSNDEVLAWFAQLKFRYELTVERIPLKYVQEWVVDDTIHHRDDKFFSVVGIQFETHGREVATWGQPLVQQRQEGIVVFIVKEIDGVLHFLVQGKVEVGNFDVAEMAATIQCVTGTYRDASKNECPPFLEYVLNARPEQVRFASMQSEEGGRFFQEQNYTAIIEADEDFPKDVPRNYIWMTLGQLRQCIRYNNFVNAQARCLLSCIGLLSEIESERRQNPTCSFLGIPQSKLKSASGAKAEQLEPATAS
jgi:oxidase EvaA